ncbi:MAG: DUF2139 domain-containing protein [candidate division Zixibacteria bacterium]|nr:DUF2139 domain-containing protein [candidate division Zixibacteria bacterium]
MNPKWAVIPCPIYGNIGKVLKTQIRKFPQPWKTHAYLCLKLELLTTTRTHIIVGLDEQHGLVASAWLSLPDKIYLSGWENSAFLFHVHVPTKYRGCGFGRSVVNFACSIAEKNCVDFVGVCVCVWF